MPTSTLAILIFLAFTGFTLGLSFWLGRKAKSSAGYFAAHGQIGPFVNGIAFAGDYLSAASFLGICGMIAFYGYDGFLYSIGFLAGWVVALFVIAEPIKKLGKYTFADALNAKFNSPGITLAAAISTLVVSVFYLVPQMVGAGALIQPLLGWPHYLGVIIVGTLVIVIVTTAGMVSTTWVQFIKGSLLVVFCLGLTVMILNRGLPIVGHAQGTLRDEIGPKRIVVSDEKAAGFASIGYRHGESNPRDPETPVSFLHNISDVVVFHNWKISHPDDVPLSHADGGRISFRIERLLPGGSPTFKGIRSAKLVDRLDFVSLMLALFCGTASLPHILIRYYTVKDAAAARKSTVVGIGAIGFFYILTLYIGLGAMVSGAMPADAAQSNMAAPLLARSFGEWPFALITAIAFTTVLGTVSGLILAAAGAVALDLRRLYKKHQSRTVSDPNVLLRSDDDESRREVRVAKLSSVGVGLIAIGLGIVFKNFSVAFLVGWAFNVAASANLPSLVMLLFWRGTTKQGIIASITVGLVSSLLWLGLSGPAFKELYGLDPAHALAPFSQPALATIPLSFATLVIVSLLTRRAAQRGFDVVRA